MSAPAMDPKWITAGEIRSARRTAGLKQAELAERVGVTEKTISNYETAVSEPTHSMFLRIIEACQTSHLSGLPAQPRLPFDLPPSRHQPDLASV